MEAIKAVRAVRIRVSADTFKAMRDMSIGGGINWCRERTEDGGYIVDMTYLDAFMVLEKALKWGWDIDQVLQFGCRTAAEQNRNGAGPN